MRTTAIAFVLGAAAVAARDASSPVDFRGIWTGNFQTRFALADPNSPNSYECLPDDQSVSIPHKLNISDYQFIDAGWASKNFSIGAGDYSFPARGSRTFGWSNYTGASGGYIMVLRYSSTQVQCHYARVTGSGTSRKLTVVTLGGAAYGWEQQCDPASYRNIPNFDTKAVCQSLPDSKAAYNTTIVGVYTTSSTQGSGAETTAAITATAALAAAAAAFIVL